MADRIFPNNINTDMGSKIQFSGINFDDVQKNMNNKYAQDNTNELMELISTLTEQSPEEIESLIDQAKQMSGDTSTDPMSHNMGGLGEMGGGDMPGASMGSHSDFEDESSDMKPEMGGAMGSEMETGPDMESDSDSTPDMGSDDNSSKPNFGDSEESDDEEDEHNPMPFKMSGNNNKMKKFAFTNSNQINAEALEKAIADKNEPLVKAIKSARKANRLRISKALETKMVKEAQVNPANENTSASNPWNEFDAATLQKMASSFSDQNSVPQGLKEAINHKNKNTGFSDSPEMTMAFTSPTKFTQAQRSAFNKIAMSLGMPEQYVVAMTSHQLPHEVVALNSKIKEVHASNISEDVKSKVVTTLIKEAKLSPDSKSEFINYWNNTLGYQDKDFWPEVATDYVDGKKAK